MKFLGTRFVEVSRIIGERNVNGRERLKTKRIANLVRTWGSGNFLGGVTRGFRNGESEEIDRAGRNGGTNGSLIVIGNEAKILQIDGANRLATDAACKTINNSSSNFVRVDVLFHGDSKLTNDGRRIDALVFQIFSLIAIGIVNDAINTTTDRTCPARPAIRLLSSRLNYRWTNYFQKGNPTRLGLAFRFSHRLRIILEFASFLGETRGKIVEPFTEGNEKFSGGKRRGMEDEKWQLFLFRSFVVHCSEKLGDISEWISKTSEKQTTSQRKMFLFNKKKRKEQMLFFLSLHIYFEIFPSFCERYIFLWTTNARWTNNVSRDSKSPKFHQIGSFARVFSRTKLMKQD